ncbi:8-oxo-dGTP diphosphatase [Marinospirillum celere]|uniref:8-oxo-dGTP diphosphatase n=1 Tax=Marinospirillum celere TaxID=1122252 RepID=A0A1I1G0G4_9GAMM|nr:Nudix family hydrolase [Marinospirillum celere]SFC04792.1 8-oxo-dGTP diphosphatase [Marinospirillum celere]
MPHPVLVAAAAIINDQQEVLISKRPHDVDQGGLWEFPGGKLAPYETGYQALKREIHEELGITLTRARPLLRINHAYPHKKILLDVWKVESFQGEPWGREGQPVRWVKLDELVNYSFPDANKPIIQALTLPDEYVITGDCNDPDHALERLQELLTAGAKLIQLRQPTLSEEDFCLLAERFQEACQAAGARLLLNAAPELLKKVDAAGIHLTGQRLMALKERPVGQDKLLAASCHDPASIRQAVKLDADFITLSPVLPTTTHPEAAPLGWQRFKELVEYEAKMPVFALGGMRPSDRQRIFALGGQGVAGISHFWDKDSRHPD